MTKRLDYFTAAYGNNLFEHEAVRGWFTPHTPVNWTGEVYDVKTGEIVKEPSMTKQSFIEECDINNIVDHYLKNQTWMHLNEKAAQGMYTDLPEGLDYQRALDIVRESQAAFDTLPAELRARFENNPMGFLEYARDPSNQQEMVDLGLAIRRPSDPPQDPPPAPKPEPKPE